MEDGVITFEDDGGRVSRTNGFRFIFGRKSFITNSKIFNIKGYNVEVFINDTSGPWPSIDDIYFLENDFKHCLDIIKNISEKDIQNHILSSRFTVYSSDSRKIIFKFNDEVTIELPFLILNEESTNSIHIKIGTIILSLSYSYFMTFIEPLNKQLAIFFKEIVEDPFTYISHKNLNDLYNDSEFKYSLKSSLLNNKRGNITICTYSFDENCIGLEYNKKEGTISYCFVKNDFISLLNACDDNTGVLLTKLLLCNFIKI